ncbi:hypothetical protein B0H13DRAFT_1904701 [Mycena leptocephala]|nr:hypothetical protein B0H13DRAFT_1904701 [Mycena leptocephala]
MTLWRISIRAYVIGYATFTIVLVLSYLPPVLLQHFYPEAASVTVAAPFVRVRDRLARGFAAHAFFKALYMFCSLINDAHKWLTGASPATRPVTLEDGTIDPAALGVAAESTESTVMVNVFSLLSFSYYFIQQWFIADIVSLRRPLLENLVAALLYTLRGLDVIFVSFLILVFVIWLKKRPSYAVAQAPARPVEVLFNGVATKEVKEYMETKG